MHAGVESVVGACLFAVAVGAGARGAWGAALPLAALAAWPMFRLMRGGMRDKMARQLVLGSVSFIGAGVVLAAVALASGSSTAVLGVLGGFFFVVCGVYLASLARRARRIESVPGDRRFEDERRR